MRQTKKIKVTHTITDTEYEVLKAMIEGIGVSYNVDAVAGLEGNTCLLYTSPSPRDRTRSRMPSSA